MGAHSPLLLRSRTFHPMRHEQRPAPGIGVADVAAHKERALSTWLLEHGSVVVGFSGGVDSAYLACVALDTLGAERVVAVIGRSPSYPAEQWETARRVADRFGIPVREIDTEEMSDPRYAANPSNRCFYCKSELWSRVVPVARELGFDAVVDGTNADDSSDHRPGAAAGAERGVLSPLAILGFTKAEIRERSRARGIPTWEQPSSPCLASRIPYGTSVTVERLAQIERAERALRALGVGGDLRVRHHGDLARVELPSTELDRWLTPGAARGLRDAVRQAAGFARVAIDLRGYRSGSLNVLGGVTAA
jgi:pyridinium-3,5-biscarboxylic acid mononucleotide sulfurtransferase